MSELKNQKMLNREDLIYEKRKNAIVFNNLKTTRSYAKNIFAGNIILNV